MSLPAAEQRASPTARQSPISLRVARIELPVPKGDGSVAGTGQSQSHELWLHFLVEGEVFRAAKVFSVLKFAVDKHLELMISRSHVADVDPLHPSLSQCFEFFRAVDVVCDELAVDLEPHAVEAHRVALGDRDEDRDLCTCWIEQ